MYVKIPISKLFSMHVAKAEIDRRKARASYRRGGGGVVRCGGLYGRPLVGCSRSIAH